MKRRVLALLLAGVLTFGGTAENFSAAEVNSQNTESEAEEPAAEELPAEEPENVPEEPVAEEPSEETGNVAETAEPVQPEEDSTAPEEDASAEETEAESEAAETDDTVIEEIEYAPAKDRILTLEEKGTLEDALAELPGTWTVETEDGESVEVPIVWECLDDFDDEDYSSFVFEATIVTEESEETDAPVVDMDALPENAPAVPEEETFVLSEEVTEQQSETLRMEVFFQDSYVETEAEETAAQPEEGPTGFVSVSYTLSPNSLFSTAEAEQKEEEEESAFASTIYTDPDSVETVDTEFWESVGLQRTDEVYQNLTANQKEFYDRIDALFDGYLAAADAIEPSNGLYVTEALSYADVEGFDDTAAQKTFEIYYASNPQAFFVTTAYIIDREEKTIRIGFLPYFYNGAERVAAANQMQSNIEALIAENCTNQTAYGKLHQAKVALCKLIKYDHNANNNSKTQSGQAQSKWIYGQIYYDQSLASVFYGKKGYTYTTALSDSTLSVCAGYGKAYSAVARRLGFTAGDVTSKTHEWSKVKLADGSWYVVDVTWDDTDNSSTIYTDKYFLVSDANASAANSAHNWEEKWEKIFPKADHAYQGENYRIVFEGNGAENGAMGTLSVLESESARLPKNEFIREDYTFLGWSESEDGPADYSDEDIIPKVSKDLTLYAIWEYTPEATSYTVNFVTGDEEITVAPMLCERDRTYYLPGATEVTRVGYKLSYWTTNADGSGTKYTPGKSFKNLKAAGDTLTLYAQWTAISYSIAYQLDSGKNDSLNPKSFTIASGTLTFYDATKSYYTFAGWSYEKGGAEISDFSATELMRHADNKNKLTLYANFTPQTYTVIYHLNARDAKTVPADAADEKKDFAGALTVSQTVNYGESALYFSTVERKDYKLASWNTRSDGKGTKYTPGATFKNLTTSNGATIDLYAQWTASTAWESYQIRYYDADGTAALSDAMTCAAGAKYTFLATPKRTGYTLSSWKYTSADGKTVKTYKPGATFTNLATTLKVDSEVKLTAVWTLNTYKISYQNMSGAKHDTKNNLSSYTVVDSKTGAAREIVLSDPTANKTGYTFAGWFDAAEDGATKVEKIDAANVEILNGKNTSKNTINIYAHWTPITYRLTYYPNYPVGAGDGPASTTVPASYGDSGTYATAPAAPAGYTFAGWCINNKGTKYKAGATFKNLSSAQDAAIELYAQWTVATYKINYNLRNGDSKGSNPTTYKLTTKDFALKNGTRSNAQFLGWYDTVQEARKAELAGEATEAAVTASNIAEWVKNGDKTLYAAWLCATYTVRYDANGGTVIGGLPAQTVNLGDTFHMPTNVERRGYQLLGWSTNQKATSAAYNLTKAYKNLTSKKDTTITVYAVWKPITISYTLNSGSKIGGGSYPTKYTTFATEIVSPAKRTNYDFGGWYLDAMFSEELSKENGEYFLDYEQINAPIKLYAKWNYKVEFDVNGGKDSEKPEEQTYYVGQAFSMPSGLTRDGYVFLGWSTSSTASSASYVLTKSYKNLSPKNDVVKLYAVWKPYTISYTMNSGSKLSGGNYPTKYTASDGKLYISPLRRDYYQFAGWYTRPDFKEGFALGEPVASGENQGLYELDLSEVTGENGTIRLYAKWTPNTYRVTYQTAVLYPKSEDGEEADDPNYLYMAEADRGPIECLAGNTYYTSTRASRRGYLLNSWKYEYSYEKSGKTYTKTGTLSPGATFKNLASEVLKEKSGAEVTMTAVWKTDTSYDPASEGTVTICEITEGKALRVEGTVSARLAEGNDLTVYLAAVNPVTNKPEYVVSEWKSGEIEGVEELAPTFSIALTGGKCDAPPLDSATGKALGTEAVSISPVVDQFAFAILEGGSYVAVSDGKYTQNPEALKVTSRFDRGETKKGIQALTYYYPQVLSDANCDQVFVNILLSDILFYVSDNKAQMQTDLIGNGFGSCYYIEYNGRYYAFNAAGINTYANFIGGLNDKGISVTAQLLLDSGPTTVQMRHSDARAGKASYYAFEDDEQDGRERLEATFLFLSEVLSGQGATSGIRQVASDAEIGPKVDEEKKIAWASAIVSNWILGNEVNSYKAWHYAGKMTKDEFFGSYENTFHTFYNTIKSVNSGAMVYVCTDHKWYTSSGTTTYGYSAKYFLDTFAAGMRGMDETVDWNIAFHPYSDSSMKRADFWNLNPGTTITASYINMKNINVLTSYAKSAYANGAHYPRVILSEQGYQYGTYQAAALAYSYAIAAANSDIVAFEIRSYFDYDGDSKNNEAKAGLRFGIANNDATYRESGNAYIAVNRAEALSQDQLKSICNTISRGATTWSRLPLLGSGFDEGVLYRNNLQ